MKQSIIQQLKTLKHIKPDAGFVARTRNTICGIEPQKYAGRLAFNFNWLRTGAFSVAGATLMIVIGIFVFAPSKTPAFASLENAQIDEEWQTLSINIQLKEVLYRENASVVIASAISEISANTQHMNESIIANEQESLNNPAGINTDIDKMLEEVLN